MTKSVHFSLFHTWQVEKLDTVTGGPSVSPQLTHTMEISLRSHTRQVFLPSLSRTYGSSDWRRKSHQWTNQTDQWFPINSRVNRESNMNECPLFWPRVKNNRTYHSRAPCPLLLGCRISSFPALHPFCTWACTFPVSGFCLRSLAVDTVQTSETSGTCNSRKRLLSGCHYSLELEAVHWLDCVRTRHVQVLFNKYSVWSVTTYMAFLNKRMSGNSYFRSVSKNFGV